MKLLLFLVLILFCTYQNSFLFVKHSIAEEISSKEVLKYYEDYLAKVNVISFVSEQQLLDQEIKTVNGKREFFVNFSQKTLWEKVSYEDMQDQIIDQPLYREILITPQTYISLSHGDYRLGKKWLVSGFSTVLGNTFQKYSLLGDNYYPFGFIDDREAETNFIPEILRYKDTELKVDVNANESLISLNSYHEIFSISLSLDKTKGFAPQRITIKQKCPDNSPNRLQYAEYFVDEFQQISGIWVPKFFTVNVTRSSGEFNIESIKKSGFVFEMPEAKNGILKVPSSESRIKILMKNVEIGDSCKNKNFSIKSKIPNGTPVTMRDAPQIEYVWMDGKPVVKTDEVALRIARGDHGFMPGPKEPRFWFIALGLVLFLVGGGLKIRSMLKTEG